MRARRVRPKSFEGHKTEFYGCWLRKYTIRRKPYSNKEKASVGDLLKGMENHSDGKGIFSNCNPRRRKFKIDVHEKI